MFKIFFIFFKIQLLFKNSFVIFSTKKILFIVFFLKILKNYLNNFLFNRKIINNYILKILNISFFILLFNFLKKRVHNIIIFDK